MTHDAEGGEGDLWTAPETLQPFNLSPEQQAKLRSARSEKPAQEEDIWTAPSTLEQVKFSPTRLRTSDGDETLVASLSVEQELERKMKIDEIFAPEGARRAIAEFDPTKEDFDLDDPLHAQQQQPESEQEAESEQRKQQQFVDLNEYQRKLLKEKRAEEYSILRRNILKTIDSHHDLADKCHLLAALHRRLVSKKMRLHLDLYEDLFACFVRHANAVQLELQSKGLADATSSSSSSCLNGAMSSDGTRVAASSTKLRRRSAANDFGFSDFVWDAFQYMLKTRPGAAAGDRAVNMQKQNAEGDNRGGGDGADAAADERQKRRSMMPSPRLFQHVMRCLQFSSSAASSNAVLEQRAHQLMTQLEQLQLSPTVPTLVSYIEICAAVGAMHIGMAAYVHALSVHQKAPTPVLCTVVINGFLSNGDVESAVSFISNMQNTAIDSALFNSILTAFRHSEQPLAAFAAFRTTIGDPTSSGADMSMISNNNNNSNRHMTAAVRGSTNLPVTEANITTLLKAWRKGFNKAAADDREDDAAAGGENNEEDFRPVLFARYASELHFLLRTTVVHRVKCGEHTLNHLLQALKEVEKMAAASEAEMRAQSGANDDNDDDDGADSDQQRRRTLKQLQMIAGRSLKYGDSLLRHMQQRGVRVHREKLLI